jgi:RNA polymerase sigma factor FliA
MAKPQEQVTQMVEEYRTYAHAIAADILKKLPPHVEKAEIQSAAELGLVEAANAFDSRPGVQFKTFAYYRIRGAVYDAIRKATWFSRSQYREFVAAAGANEYFADQAASPSANKAGTATVEELDSHVGAVVACFMLSLDAQKSEPRNTVVDPKESAESQLIKEEWGRRLRDALARLPEKNRKVIEGCYYQNRTLEDVGADMGLSKSWTCRIHAKGIEMLREMLGPAGIRATLAAQAR